MGPGGGDGKPPTCEHCGMELDDDGICPWCSGEETAHARKSDPETSHEAAESVEVVKNQLYVLAAFSQICPCTDKTLVATYQRLSEHTQSDSGIRTRRKELVRKGIVRWTGDWVRGDTNRRERVWDLMRKGDGDGHADQG